MSDLSYRDTKWDEVASGGGRRSLKLPLARVVLACVNAGRTRLGVFFGDRLRQDLESAKPEDFSLQDKKGTTFAICFHPISTVIIKILESVQSCVQSCIGSAWY
jgi:hypothetical protein